MASNFIRCKPKAIHVFKSIALFFIISIYNSFVLAAPQSVNIDQGWIPEMPPGSRVMAGFATIKNTGNTAAEIISIHSPAFKHIEIHLSKQVDGIARMLPQKSLVIAANSSIELKHGSYHLMLFNPVKPLKAGDRVEFTANLKNGHSVRFNSLVKIPDDMSEHHHHHHMAD